MQAHNDNPYLRKLTDMQASYKGVNYSVIIQAYNGEEVENLTYECNCSTFKTKSEVESFIDEVFFA